MYYLTDTIRYLLEYPEDESDLSLTRIGSDPVKFSSIFTPSSTPPIPSSPSSSSHPATSTSTSTTSTTTVNHLDHPSELPPDPKPSQSCWSHIVFWSIDDHCVRSFFPSLSLPVHPRDRLSRRPRRRLQTHRRASPQRPNPVHRRRNAQALPEQRDFLRPASRDLQHCGQFSPIVPLF